MAGSNYMNITLKLFNLILAITTVLGKGTAPHDIDCTDATDGLHEIGCWGYADCVNGKPVVNECGVDLVFDRASMKCVKPGTTQTDCFLPVDCNGKPDASYPDYTDSCVTYYRCINQKNLGRFYCPAQTAFNENLQICDYPQNLPPPCGSKLGPNHPPVTTQKATTPTTTQTMMTTTTPKPTTTQTTMPSTMTTTPKMMTSPATMNTTAQSTQKPMQTSQLQIILTTGLSGLSSQASTQQMPTSSKQP